MEEAQDLGFGDVGFEDCGCFYFGGGVENCVRSVSRLSGRRRGVECLVEGGGVLSLQDILSGCCSWEQDGRLEGEKED